LAKLMCGGTSSACLSRERPCYIIKSAASDVEAALRSYASPDSSGDLPT